MDADYAFLNVMRPIIDPVQSDGPSDGPSTASTLTDISDGTYRYEEQQSSSNLEDDSRQNQGQADNVSLKELLQLWGVEELENYFMGKSFKNNYYYTSAKNSTFCIIILLESNNTQKQFLVNYINFIDNNMPLFGWGTDLLIV